MMRLATCGDCLYFEREESGKQGICQIKKYLLDKHTRRLTTRLFIPYQSRKACKMFEKKEK